MSERHHMNKKHFEDRLCIRNVNGAKQINKSQFIRHRSSSSQCTALMLYQNELVSEGSTRGTRFNLFQQ